MPGHIDAQIQLLEVDGKPALIYGSWGNNSHGEFDVIYATADSDTPQAPNDWTFSLAEIDHQFNWGDFHFAPTDAQNINGKPAFAFSNLQQDAVRLNLAMEDNPESPSDWDGITAISNLEHSIECVAMAMLEGKGVVAANTWNGELGFSIINTSRSEGGDEIGIIQSFEPVGFPCFSFDIVGIGDTLLIASAGDVEGRNRTALIWVLPHADPAKATSIELGVSYPFQPLFAQTDKRLGLLWMDEIGLQFAWCDYANSGGFSEWQSVRVTSGIALEYGLCFSGEQPGIAYWNNNSNRIFYAQPKAPLAEKVEWERARIGEKVGKYGVFDLRLEVINGEPYIAYMTNEIVNDQKKTASELQNGALYLAYPEPGQSGFPKKWITTTVIEPQYEVRSPLVYYLLLPLLVIAIVLIVIFFQRRRMKMAH